MNTQHITCCADQRTMGFYFGMLALFYKIWYMYSPPPIPYLMKIPKEIWDFLRPPPEPSAPLSLPPSHYPFIQNLYNIVSSGSIDVFGQLGDWLDDMIKGGYTPTLIHKLSILHAEEWAEDLIQ